MEITPFRRFTFLLLSSLSVVQAQSLELQPAERIAEPIVDPASDEAQRAIQRFSLPPGFQAKLWAAEPMLANPVAIDFDEKGRLFVSETHRYRTSVLDIRNYMGMVELDLAARTLDDRVAMVRKVFGEEGAKQLAIESELVRLVEDRDGDGVADTSSVFATDFDSELDGIASGVLARKGKVWFTNIPSLWLLEWDGTGSVATKRTELLRGFGVRFNYTGHDFHGLAIGHDGKLYYSIGDRGVHVRGKEGQLVAVPDEGAVFRSNFDGTEFELFARGLRNPQELAFDEHGNLFTGDNDSDNGDLERLVYLTEGSDSGWRVGYQHAPLGKGGPWLDEHLWKPRFPGQAAYLLPPICNIEDGPSGLTYYPGTGLSPEFQGHFFITHFKGSIARSGIQTYTVKPAGAGFAITSSSLFMGGVLATDVTFGPDGIFYVADWVEGWPKSQRGRIYGITPINEDGAQKAMRAQVAKLLAEGFEKTDVAQLRGYLAHPDRRIRLEAQFALVDRGAESIGLLKGVASDAVAAPLARLHAVWGLGQLGRKNAEASAIIRGLLNDGDAEVRAQAAKLMGDLGVAAAGGDLLAKLQDAAPRVQFFAAQSLGKLKAPGTTAALIELLRRHNDQDASLRHTVVRALAHVGDRAALATAAKDASAAVRLGVLLAYRELQDAAIGAFLNDSDPFLVREAALAINDRPVEGAYAALAAKLATAPIEDTPLVLRAINANFRLGQPENARALAEYAARTDLVDSIRAEALLQLGLWADVPQRDRIVGVYRPLPARETQVANEALAPLVPKLLADASEEVRLATLEAVEDLKLTSASSALHALVRAEAAPAPVRARALRVLDTFNDAQLDAAIQAAAQASVAEVSLAALQIQARRSPAAALPIISRLAEQGGAEEQRAAYLALSELDLPETPRLLIAAVDRLQAGKVAASAQAELLNAVETSTAPEVQARWEALKQSWQQSGDALAPFRAALEGGFPTRGKRLFDAHPVLACLRCHKVNGDGGEAGPDLTLVGANKSPEYILESIIKPNAKIAEGFNVISVQTAKGEWEAGTVERETETELVLKRADGSMITLDPKTIKERQAAPSSMPEIYGQVMSRTELRDLVAYVKSLKVVEPKLGQTSRATTAGASAGKTGGHE